MTDAAPSLVGRRWPIAAIGGLLIVVLLALLFRQESGTRQTPTAPVASGTDGIPPDISSMSPRERFDRLYNRIMEASERGDTASVTRFLPMALAAYSDLGETDADAQYHAAMLRLHTGDPTGARALTDSIAARTPGHLFSYLLRGALVRWQGDSAALAKVYREFAAKYDAEIAANRPEYKDHSVALERFLEQAKRASSTRRP